MSKRSIIVLALLALLVLTAALAGSVVAREVQFGRQVAAVRAATSKYHDVNVAIADGYLPTQQCVAGPEGGVHSEVGQRMLSPDNKKLVSYTNKSRTDQAVTIFNRLLGHANPLGLFSEDIDPSTGRLLGNFPQAYTHVGLIHAAITIGEILEARTAHFRAWT